MLLMSKGLSSFYNEQLTVRMSLGMPAGCST
jgi:hypothetical protein